MTTKSTIEEEERDALVAIAHGAVVTSGGISIQRITSMATEGILTRGLGPELYGVYAFGYRIVQMVLKFANLGATTTILRDIPAFSDTPHRQERSLGLSYLSTIVTSLVLAVIIAVLAEWINAVTIDHPSFPDALVVFAGLLVIRGLIRMAYSSLRAVNAANSEVLLNRVLPGLVELLAAGIAMWLGLQVVGTVTTLTILLGVLAVISIPVTIYVTGIRPSFRGLRSEMWHFFDHAVPSALSGVGNLLRTRIDVLLIGILLTATEAGIYNVVLVLVGLAGIPLTSFNQLMPPVSADLYANGHIEVLNQVYRTITRLIVIVTVPMIVLLAFFGEVFLGIFGETYVQGYAVLLIFLVGRFIGNAVGATGILLSMTNNHYPKMVLEWFLAVLNVILTVIFVIQFGLIGAALGTSLAIAIQNLLQAVLLYRFEGLWPFDRTFFLPILAGCALAGVLGMIDVFLTGIGVILVGVSGGLLTYVAVLILGGIDPRDRLVIRELVSVYRRT